MKRLMACVALIGACGTGYAQQSSGDRYPSKAVRFICPFPPGGLNDLLARYFAQRMSDVMGQQVFVDNRNFSAPWPARAD